MNETLYLPLKAKWYKMIESGEKTEEYREIKPYWCDRILHYCPLATIIAKLISPKSYSEKKADTFECGIPTRGESMIQFHAGYYIFAILFLIFDVETVFLFPWAVVANGMGVKSLLCIGIFMVILVLGLAYAWKKGALKWK